MLKIVSLVLNGVWVILLIPMIPVCFMAGVATLMMTDSGEVNSIQVILIIFSTCLFWAVPILAFLSVLFSFALRKKGRFLMSVILQLSPVATALIAFCALLFMTVLQ